MTSFVARTHPGLRRAKNEDCYRVDEELGLWVVADGLGGHSNGEIASSIACDVIMSQVRDGASLSDAIEQAHRAVLKEIADRGIDGNMGTTVVALQLNQDHYDIAWVGDSRAYLYDGHLRQLTADHSAVNELLEKGAIDRRHAATHPQRHALSRSLGVSSQNRSEASVISGTLRPGQQILLCTDGLTDELDDAQINAELRINRSAAEQADALVKAALNNGGRDNLTLVIVEGGKAPWSASSSQGPDLETTQNLGAALPVDARPSGHRGGLVALVLVLSAAAAIAIWKAVAGGS